MKINIMTLKQYVHNHPRLDLLQYVIRKKLPSINACREMMEIEKNPLIVRYRHYGELNKGVIIYHIRVERKMGYCAMFIRTLFYLAYANRMGFIPFVEWTKETLYTEENAVNGKNNGFEYFMEISSSLTIDDVLNSDLVVCSKFQDGTLIFNSDLDIAGLYGVKEDELKIMSEMFNEYIRFNETGEREIVNPAKQLLNQYKCLGVHVRGTDFNQNFHGHPKAILIEKYISQVEEIFSSNKYEYIFLATDEVQTVGKFRDKFGEKLLYYDVLRSENGKAIHYGNADMRQNNRYYLGMEILKDVYTLGHCNGLIAGTSSVSIMARVIKRSTGLNYDDEIIMNEGINQNLHMCHNR